MPIYDIFDTKENHLNRDLPFPNMAQSIPGYNGEQGESILPPKDQIFSTVAARLFFLLLFTADLLWAIYTISVFSLWGLMALASGRKVPFLIQKTGKSWISVKRSLVCGLSLLITLFSPAFGIMIACTYFLMYDKAGIEEVVPASLQDQFKDFFKT